MRYFCLLLLLTACSSKPVPSQEEVPGTIAIIFGAHPDYRHNLPEGIAQYTDDHLIKRSLRPNQDGDTLTFFTDREVIALTHTYPYQDEEDGPVSYSQLHYVVQRGDTVRFSYNGFEPQAEVLNREVLPYDLNYSLASWEQLYERKAPVRIFMFDFPFDPNWTEEERHENFLQHVHDVTQQDLDEIAREDAFLDSLFAAGQMAEPVYEYQKAINYFRVMDPDLKREQVHRYVNQSGLGTTGEGELQATDYVPQVSIEELATVGSIRYALNDYTAYRFDIPTVSETYDGSGQRYPDYPIKFDSTLQAEWLPRQVKEALLMDDLKGIMEEYPVAYRFRYLSKFKEFASDTTMVNHITSQYSLEAGEEEEILLEDMNGNTKTFSEVLATYAGKVVYIDWWAGWCSPCIQAMPDLQVLEDSLAGKDAVILYISIDELQEAWKESAKTLPPGTDDFSYRVSNKFVSRQFETFNIQYIPRYFLVDRQGQVVNDYAPGPEEEGIVEVIATLLEE